MPDNWPDSDVDSLNSDTMKDWAEKNGFVCVYPAPNELQIDIDNLQSKQALYDRLNLLEHNLKLIDLGAQFRADVYRESQSKTNDGRHYHITVTLNKSVSDLERIFLQAALGSDGKRELLSFQRLQEGDPHPTMFVEKVSINA